MSNNITGKVIVITGASSGLGEAAARHLSAQGATVVLGARRADRIRALADELVSRGGKALSMHLLNADADIPLRTVLAFGATNPVPSRRAETAQC